LAGAVVIIPARYASTRFPGKVLARETGKYLIQHVYERAYRAKSASRVIIAADDPRTVKASESFGAEVAMTDPALSTGTDRVAAVAKTLAGSELIINVQADEPELESEHIDQLADLLDRTDAPMATLATPFSPEADPEDPHCVKVVCDRAGYAMYFSRSLIPYAREGRPNLPADWRYLLHLGIYGYRRAFLLELTRLPPAPIEQIEKLEQLRVLWHGRKIKVGLTDHCSRGIDTPHEYKLFVQRHLQSQRS